MDTLKHNANNRHKIELRETGGLWSHTVCLQESCLRLFDVNQCMKDRSNWPGVTLTFRLFNHVLHVRCVGKKSLLWCMFLFLFLHCMRQVYSLVLFYWCVAFIVRNIFMNHFIYFNETCRKGIFLVQLQPVGSVLMQELLEKKNGFNSILFTDIDPEIGLVIVDTDPKHTVYSESIFATITLFTYWWLVIAPCVQF